jgi:hypothetical protein
MKKSRLAFFAATLFIFSCAHQGTGRNVATVDPEEFQYNQASITGSIFGCMGEKREKYSVEKIIVFRLGPKLRPLYTSFAAGKVVILRAFSHGPGNFGTQLSRIENESTDVDPGFEKEEWKMTVPPNAIYTGRGNYTGFYLFPGRGKKTVGTAEDSHAPKFALTKCSEKVDEVAAWIATAPDMTPIK